MKKEIISQIGRVHNKAQTIQPTASQADSGGPPPPPPMKVGPPPPPPQPPKGPTNQPASRVNSGLFAAIQSGTKLKRRADRPKKVTSSAPTMMEQLSKRVAKQINTAEKKH